MKVRWLFFVFLACGVFLNALAQVPQQTQLQHTSLASYRDTPEGKKLDFVITGGIVTNLSARTFLVNEFEMKSFRNGDAKQVQIIAQAPQCRVDMAKNTESDPGPLQVYTPETNHMTNLFVQGVGFLFVQSNHFLMISNQVETRVVKALMKSSALAAARTNTVADHSQILKIFAQQGRFDFDSNVVDYAGNVHLIDPQLDLTCELLTIHFSSNGVLESILARQNVVLTTTNHGRATGETAFYYVTNRDEMMRLTTEATWRNGDEEAKAEEFTYDSARHLLTGIGHVRVQWPNGTPNPLGRSVEPPGFRAGTNGFRKLFADFATLLFPPTNGPVESMQARGNVLIVNQADQSSATAGEALYEKATDRVELTVNPVWWNSTMEVKADTLTAELNAKTYHARSNARFKIRTGGSGTNRAAVKPGHATNQWLFISSDDMDYETNRATFSRNVATRVEEDGRMRDTLNCDHLTVETNNGIESAFATGNVHGETAPDVTGMVKTITCERLNAYRNIRTGLMKSFDAHVNVVIEEKWTGPGAPSNKLSADTVTAQFSAVTNQLEQAVAVQNVVLDHFKAGQNTHATAERAVYSGGTNDEVKLTGNPLAYNKGYSIMDADYMIWQPKANTFRAFGRYIIVPPKSTNSQKAL